MDNYMKILERKIVENNADQIEDLLRKKNMIITAIADNSIDPNKTYSTAEICSRLGIERHQVYKLIESGELRGKKLKSWKIPHASLAAYLAKIME
ncbi:MAG: helix-turn-helix domain-containing protein [Cyclobacteriaceae bacterium]|nr:helix-turn-helix domain-containing protein [Cyclobacteriaceae bacterium]